jgi:hypothetical protein
MAPRAAPLRPVRILFILSAFISFFNLPVFTINEPQVNRFHIYMMLGNTFSYVTFPAQNCNSLNMSHSTKQNQYININAIANLKADITFLSDLRLGNKNLTSSKNDICNMFMSNQHGNYDFYTNSTQNKRVVGILVKKGLDFQVITEVKDVNENFLLLKANVKGSPVILGSLYGPNEHDPGFFITLFRTIRSMGDHPIILGGGGVGETGVGFLEPEFSPSAPKRICGSMSKNYLDGEQGYLR